MDYQRVLTHYYRWTIIPTSAILPTLQSLACGDNAVQTLINKQPFVNKVDYLSGGLFIWRFKNLLQFTIYLHRYETTGDNLTFDKNEFKQIHRKESYKNEICFSMLIK